MGLIDMNQFNPHPLTLDMPITFVLYPAAFVTLYVIYCFVGTTLLENAEDKAILNKFLQYFNFFRIIGQTVVAIWLLYLGVSDGHHLFCTPIPATSQSGTNALNIAWGIWAYYIFKLIDLLDCISIIQSGAEVNSLQMYHHTSLVFISWAGVKYFPGGTTIVPIIVNSFCQFGFYVFHKLNKMRPLKDQVAFEVALYTMQVIQFTIILLHTAGRPLQTCGYPLIATIGLALYITIFGIGVISFWSLPIFGFVGVFGFCGGHGTGARDKGK